ncbi:hypothetical protein F5144DRAFT_479538 [Chaetomium tenue]|uniref:Uncharacterized protein n=1 Tax=Chaetomium tenue TaxID=1854479 RepID=A0ACB7PQW2_9PEZI|nr:hypothetical protein F5144DRAFT_479538 [Chaetomium globosum]
MASLAELITYKPTDYITLAPARDIYVNASGVMSAIVVLPLGDGDSEPSLQCRLRLWRVQGDGSNVLDIRNLTVTEGDDTFEDGEVVHEGGQYKVKFAFNYRVTGAGTYYFGFTFQGFLTDTEYISEVEEKTDRFDCTTPPDTEAA